MLIIHLVTKRFLLFLFGLEYDVFKSYPSVPSQHWLRQIGGNHYYQRIEPKKRAKIKDNWETLFLQSTTKEF